MIGQQDFIEIISVNGTDPTDNRVLKLQRYLLDRSNYSELPVRNALWARRIDASEHNAFIFEDGRFTNVDMDCDIIERFVIPNGPVVVAIGKEVVAEEARILFELNRAAILPQRR